MSDINWHQLLDGYRKPYDPRPALEAWKSGEGNLASTDLWARLVHQGDTDSAAYASVPQLVQIIERTTAVDWNAYALLAVIEEARLARHNPPVPASLMKTYQEAWAAIVGPALRDLRAVQDDLSVRSILAVLAHSKGQHSLATLALLTEDERKQLLDR
jgi:hypothetical protein